MKKSMWCCVGIGVAMSLAVCAQAEPKAISKERYLDKCKGAWAGQMIGVCYGAQYEFQSNAKILEGPLEAWKPERVEGAIGQDDCYVEMTFLKALEKYGLDITYEQAGKEFAESKYELWHANKFGRENVRRGIMPPKSGNPEFNRHADDIDFQIEADLLGILCPGLPQESNRLCDLFGHIMNYGDGVYGGMFIAGMYAAAYFEDHDVEKVIHAGLACIPEQSTYHKCMADVIQWHAENPKDWRATWKKIEDKWQDDVDCQPGDPVNIDAKLNGAYILMGLLYGDGDLLKTMEVTVRCGQDNDCNPSSAAGVLCCMKGYAALAPEWTSGIPAIGKTPFSFTDYSFDSLIPACQRMTEAIVQRTGGKITGDGYQVAVQTPKPAKLEQWPTKREDLKIAITSREIAMWDPKWTVVACGHDMAPGVKPDYNGRPSVLMLHPVTKDKPAAIKADLEVPTSGQPKLVMEAASDKRGDCLVRVFVNDKLAKEFTLDTKGEWTTLTVDLKPFLAKDKTLPIRVENAASGWSFEAAYFASIQVKN